MIIFTILMIFLTTYSLIMGAPFVNTRKQLAEACIAACDGGTPDGMAVLKGIGAMLVGFFMVLLHLIYLGFAFPIDVLHYPTLFLVTYILGSSFYYIIKANLSKPKDIEVSKAEFVLSTAKIKRYSFRHIFWDIVWLVYLGYILLLQMGVTLC